MNVLSRALRLINHYIYIQREREKESENSLLGNEKQQKQQQKQLCGRQHDKKKWEDK